MNSRDIWDAYPEINKGLRMSLDIFPIVKVAQSCLTLCDPTSYTIHRILQARILEWVAFSFSRGSSQARIEPRSPTLQVDYLPAEPQGKPNNVIIPLNNYMLSMVR